MDIEMPMTRETEQLEEEFRRQPTRGRDGGAARVGAADADRCSCSTTCTGWTRPRPTCSPGSSRSTADLPWLDPGHPPGVRGRVQGARRCRRPVAEPEAARRRRRRRASSRPRPADGRSADTSSSRSRSVRAAIRCSCGESVARRGRVGHAGAGVARHGRGAHDRRDRPTRPTDRALLRHAAVLGATFPLSVLVEMLGGRGCASGRTRVASPGRLRHGGGTGHATLPPRPTAGRRLRGAALPPPS